MLMLSAIYPASADRGVIPGSDADVYNPGQKAVIAWNGEREILILSTDLYSSKETKALEILPLPSKPEVRKGTLETFKNIQKVILNHSPALPGKRAAELTVVFHEKIGAHDITIVKAKSGKELERFAADHAAKNGLGSLHYPENFGEIVSDYLMRGYNYWVFDVIDLKRDAGSVDPVVYEFGSPMLYYPLKISALAKGKTTIILYLITGLPIEEGALPDGFRIARYFKGGEPVRFMIKEDELKLLDEEVKNLLGGSGWLTAVRYDGDVKSLEEDLELKLEECRSISVKTDREIYRAGEEVITTLQYVHLKPGCVEIQVLHYHEIRLEILDEYGSIVADWAWATRGDLDKVIRWRAENPGTYVVRASSWFNGEKLEVEDSKTIEVLKNAGNAREEGVELFLYGVAVGAGCVIVGAVLAYVLMKERTKKGERAG